MSELNVDTQVKTSNSVDKTVGDKTGESPQDWKAMAEDFKAQVNALKSKNEELIGEKRKAQAAREQAKIEKAKKEKDFEQLYKSSEDKVNKLLKEHDDYRSKIAQKETRLEAMKLSAELADGPNAELLSEFIQKRIRHTDEGIKVLSKDGELTVSTLEELKIEFQNNEKFKSLLRGSKSSGGSAQGSGNSVSGSKVLKRTSFDAKTPAEQMALMKDGWKLVE